MFFGAHVSTAGGLENAPKNAAVLGCEVLQMFTRPPQGGPAGKITDEIIANFKREREKNQIHEVAVHTPYYLNLASADEGVRNNSIRIIREDLERASMIGAEYCMTHLGSGRELGKEKATGVVSNCLQKILDGYKGSCEFLIEIAAGAGETMGASFEQIGEILNYFKADALGICFDTQHAFASGYDLRDTEAVQKTFDLFDRVIGLKRLKMSHCNDSVVELSARRDRHEHLGKGKIGLNGFRALIGEPRLAHLNWYLETDPAGVKEDLEILKSIRAGL